MRGILCCVRVCVRVWVGVGIDVGFGVGKVVQSQGLGDVQASMFRW